MGLESSNPEWELAQFRVPLENIYSGKLELTFFDTVQSSDSMIGPPLELPFPFQKAKYATKLIANGKEVSAATISVEGLPQAAQFDDPRYGLDLTSICGCKQKMR